jgi:hypothetical protein
LSAIRGTGKIPLFCGVLLPVSDASIFGKFQQSESEIFQMLRLRLLRTTLVYTQ